MRFVNQIVFSIALLILAPGITARVQQNAQERAASLRLQLNAVQTKQEELQARLQELDELLKPENIASALAGVGSVHPEELREQRRRKLANERAGLNAQLEQLAASRTRLETAIAEADAAAYQQSARPNTSGANPKGPNATGDDSKNVAPQTVFRQRPRRVRRHKKNFQNP